ncbi:MAG TPA: nuclear transport factor 2 family protein [Burkholderiales bacterium]|nr:nuclear transport factor 2 family protein [Burkholderiales bacterium]
MPAAIEKELLDLEKQYWEAMQNRDGATATRLSDARCVVVGPQGIGKLDRQALAGLVENAPYELKRWRFDDDVQISTIADGVALIAYKVSEEMIIDGKTTTLEAFDSSVWVRRDGGWVCAAHTETLAGDPYGRNK